ncbi:hypothetical protein [Nonomuraea dietziae]|uniref:hypothetical protein n=1 Tax=Nonomuraea dietziae TaxID=65515 RepID=UPI0031D3486B
MPGAIWIGVRQAQRASATVDGNDYVDMHGGFGVGLAGHAHPAVVEALTGRARLGTHFGQPTEDTHSRRLQAAARALRPAGLGFGTPAPRRPMDAFQLDARAHRAQEDHSRWRAPITATTTRCRSPPITRRTATSATRRAPLGAFGPGLPSEGRRVDAGGAVSATSTPCGGCWRPHQGQVAGMIIEPIMMKLRHDHADGVTDAELRRCLHSHGAYLTYDDGQDGAGGRAPAGPPSSYGVTPDIVCLARPGRRRCP